MWNESLRKNTCHDNFILQFNLKVYYVYIVQKHSWSNWSYFFMFVYMMSHTVWKHMCSKIQFAMQNGNAICKMAMYFCI